ncbi:TIGR03571 family LLM class oxidoreductase [Echinicola sediminis]
MDTICKLHHPGRMSIGLEMPLDNDWSIQGEKKRKEEGRPFGVPDMNRHLVRAKMADQLGFNTLWLREVPLYDPSFGDGAQLFDTLSYLGYLAGITDNILLGTAAMVMPLHHPLQLAKATATIEQLSGSRFILGLGLGDRPVEFAVFGTDPEGRSERFRAHYDVLQEAWKEEHHLQQYYQNLNGNYQVYPKPRQKLPVVLAGRAQQSMDWIAQNMDGWFNYPRPVEQAQQMVLNWREALYDSEQPEKPYITAFHLNLLKDKDAAFSAGRFGGSIGIHRLTDLMMDYQKAGVSHMAIHLRRSELPIEEALEQLGQKVLPHFKNQMADCLPK